MLHIKYCFYNKGPSEILYITKLSCKQSHVNFRLNWKYSIILAVSVIEHIALSHIKTVNSEIKVCITTCAIWVNKELS